MTDESPAVDPSTVKALLAATDRGEVCQRVAKRAGEWLPSDRQVIALESTDSVEPVVAVGRERPESDPATWDTMLDDDVRTDVPEAGTVDDVPNKEWSDEPSEDTPTVRSLVWASIDGHGIVYAESTGSDDFEQSHRERLERLADYAATALERCQKTSPGATDGATIPVGSVRRAGDDSRNQSAAIDDRTGFVLDATDSVLWELNLETQQLRLDGPVDRLLENDGRDEYDVESFLERFVYSADVERITERMHSVSEGETDRVELRYRLTPAGSSDRRWFRARAGLQDGVLIGLSNEIADTVSRERRIKNLQRWTTRLIGAESRAAIAKTAVRAAEATLPLPLSSVHLRGEDDDMLSPIAANDPVTDAFDGAPVFDARTDEGLDQLVWETLESGRPTVVEEPADDGRLQKAEVPLETLVVHPLDTHGVFLTGASEPTELESVDVALSEVLGMSLVAALDRNDREQSLQAQARELERKNERLEKFTSIVSHDLRNPLNVALGRVEYVSTQVEDDQHLQTAETALERMETIISETLALARHGNRVESVSPVHLEGLVDRCWQHVGTGNATLEVRFEDDDAATVRADDERLPHLFENLFRNAVEHGPTDASGNQGGGDLTIRVGGLDDGSGFYVADDGRGIPPEERADVFEAGHTTAADGTGFGLALVEDIVEAHGWEIQVTESAGGGARFEVSGVE